MVANLLSREIGGTKCRHYRTVPDAARPATPTDKGRTERDIGYAKGSAVREAGAHAARFLHELRQGSWVFGDQLARMAALVERHGPAALNRACERALFYGATNGTRPLQRILERGLEAEPLPSDNGHGWSSPGLDLGRPLAEYDRLLGTAAEVGP